MTFLGVPPLSAFIAGGESINFSLQVEGGTSAVAFRLPSRPLGMGGTVDKI